MSRPASGHLYFTLKDQRSQIRCVMWNSATDGLRFRPENGLAVRLRGTVGIYAARGDIQVTAHSMEPAGEGDLQRALAMLKSKLESDGLFDPGRKRPLPTFPSCIGVVTSSTSAAFRDISTVLARRFPLARVVIRSVLVQGKEASLEIAAALNEFSLLPKDHEQRPDLIVLARGGGSLEDLWAFNEERTVRAVFASSIPILTGVGHETDTTLCDLVADRRAATPSMAAELAVPDRTDLANQVRRVAGAQHASLRTRVQRARTLVESSFRVRSHSHPTARLEKSRQQLDDAALRLDRAINLGTHRSRLAVKARMASWVLLDPLRPLAKGFALVSLNGRQISKLAAVPEEASLDVRFSDGSMKVKRLRNEVAPTSYTPDSETTESP